MLVRRRSSEPAIIQGHGSGERDNDRSATELLQEKYQKNLVLIVASATD
jgi:hypothetical protein